MKTINTSNFTPRAKRVLDLSHGYALRHKHSIIGTPHLLISLFELWEGAHAHVLEKLGFPKQLVLAEAQQLAAKEAARVSGNLDYSNDVLERIERAQQFAKAMRHTFLGTEHLLLSLIEGNDATGFSLRDADLQIDTIREEVLMELDPNYRPGDLEPYAALRLLVDPGSAPPEVIADILSHLSTLYRLQGGSGITFEFENIYMLAGDLE